MRLKAPVSKAAILPAFDFARAAKGPTSRQLDHAKEGRDQCRPVDVDLKCLCARQSWSFTHAKYLAPSCGRFPLKELYTRGRRVRGRALTAPVHPESWR